MVFSEFLNLDCHPYTETHSKEAKRKKKKGRLNTYLTEDRGKPGKIGNGGQEKGLARGSFFV